MSKFNTVSEIKDKGEQMIAVLIKLFYPMMYGPLLKELGLPGAESFDIEKVSEEDGDTICEVKFKLEETDGYKIEGEAITSSSRIDNRNKVSFAATRVTVMKDDKIVYLREYPMAKNDEESIFVAMADAKATLK